jgi:hypothetical protein
MSSTTAGAATTPTSTGAGCASAAVGATTGSNARSRADTAREGIELMRRASSAGA